MGQPGPTKAAPYFRFCRWRCTAAVAQCYLFSFPFVALCRLHLSGRPEQRSDLRFGNALAARVKLPLLDVGKIDKTKLQPRNDDVPFRSDYHSPGLDGPETSLVIWRSAPAPARTTFWHTLVCSMASAALASWFSSVVDSATGG